MAAEGAELTEFLAEADRLNNDNKFEEVWEHLKKAPSEHAEHAEVLWRKARGAYDLADLKPSDKAWRETHYREGLALATQALEKDPTSFGPHKWYAILLSSLGDFIATKEKIQNSFLIKEHAIKALEAKPNDPTTLHMLGRWCYSVASVGWMERKLASAIFGSPPESSYAEAIDYFERANEQHKWPGNLLWLGMAAEAAGDKAKAKAAFKAATELPAPTARDQEHQAAARKKL